ncbi:erythroblast NAD(P)(+)--arginine ADP-ribosyltransferase-like isoform X2 [Thamnophis elegans]|uniref:erythroblast NAD(P)(+)--arginine ADP-ribosyltransferase-like isoform X2 n=1 Tax=Thamnophis elegans TaxID=35005 RepID=UPI0013782466|nr:erythroblast NAD(P)(+)--arginine ADP-ribosyltransferase-like isoform X2 [Thamnophis elegans]
MERHLKHLFALQGDHNPAEAKRIAQRSTQHHHQIVLCLVEIPLNMFSNSMDDQYIDCSSTREFKLQESGNIPLEEKYQKTWETAKSHWDSLGQTVGSFSAIYGTAIVAYTVGDSLYRDFNTAAREAGKSQDSYEQYAFKDFHLLLTKALQAKKKTSDCYEVFRGINGIHFTTSNKAVVRFGQFASSSLDKKVAQGFGEDTFFSIKTCYGVPIHDFSFHEKQKEILIPPYETFTVTNYTKTQNGIFIRLESLKVYSHFNCEVLKDAGLSTAMGMPFFLWGLLLTWTTLGSLGSL